MSCFGCVKRGGEIALFKSNKVYTCLETKLCHTLQPYPGQEYEFSSKIGFLSQVPTKYYV